MTVEPNILAAPYARDSVDSVSAIKRIIEFYEEASLDYEYWSANFNMHLGFYPGGWGFLRRETMLEQMNLEIAERLRIDVGAQAFLIDLGCGTGAVSRTMAKNFSNAIIKGATLSPLQVEIAAKLNERENLHHRIKIFKGDYTKLPFEAESADGVWAVESACYADGAGKENLIREMRRVLKSGGRFAVADCFVKQPAKEFNFAVGKCYQKVCDCWALAEMPVLESFVETLKKHGFEDVLIEDISYNVAPSLCHAPLAVAGFIFKKLLAGEKLNRQSVNNLKASLLAIALGLNRSKFSYCLISGTRG